MTNFHTKQSSRKRVLNIKGYYFKLIANFEINPSGKIPRFEKLLKNAEQDMMGKHTKLVYEMNRQFQEKYFMDFGYIYVLVTKFSYQKRYMDKEGDRPLLFALQNIVCRSRGQVKLNYYCNYHVPYMHVRRYLIDVWTMPKEGNLRRPPFEDFMIEALAEHKKRVDDMSEALHLIYFDRKNRCWNSC